MVASQKGADDPGGRGSGGQLAEKIAEKGYRAGERESSKEKRAADESKKG